MARDTQLVARLQALVLEAAAAQATPALSAALGSLATATDLRPAAEAYRAALADVVGGRAALDRLLDRVAAAPVDFLGADVATRLVREARARGVDLAGGVDLGPAGVTLTAPSVTVRPDPAVLADVGREALGHLPIDGLAARLDLGPVRASGSGFIDAAQRRAGAHLRADLGPATADVALLVDTRPGLAVLALLRAELRPTGVQLGLGFSLDGIGGVVGINRTVDGDALRDRIGDGSALDALFGGGTAPHQIRATFDALADVFPPRSGTHVVGPTVRLGWLNLMGGSLARLDLGIVTVLPSGRVLVPGRIVVEVPGPGVPLVHLRLDVLGEIDVAGSRLALDAALVDSAVLGAFTVTGTAAARLAWGAQPVVLATVGGFYPGFRHEPVVLPPQRRIGITIGNPLPVGLRISLEGYVATAAGTLQAGASASVAFEVLGTGISGGAGFDAIVQLAPLWFEARVHGRVALRALGRKLVGVDLRGTLTGPGPLVLTATATGEILCFDVGGTKRFTLAGGGGADRALFDGFTDVVRRQMLDPACVAAEGGADPSVVLAPRPAADAPLLPAGAALEWVQEAFPLDGPCSKAGGRVLRWPSSVVVRPGGQAPAPTTPVRRPLTTAAYAVVAGADALAVPPFDLREAGWRLDPVVAHAGGHTADTDHRMVRLPVRQGAAPRWHGAAAGMALPFALHDAVRALDAPAAVAAGVGPAVEVHPELWSVVTADGPAEAGTSGAAAHAIAAVAGGRPLPREAATAVVLP